MLAAATVQEINVSAEIPRPIGKIVRVTSAAR
jgi:hypothetical protein